MKLRDSTATVVTRDTRIRGSRRNYEKKGENRGKMKNERTFSSNSKSVFLQCIRLLIVTSFSNVPNTDDDDSKDKKREEEEDKLYTSSFNSRSRDSTAAFVRRASGSDPIRSLRTQPPTYTTDSVIKNPPSVYLQTIVARKIRKQNETEETTRLIFKSIARIEKGGVQQSKRERERIYTYDIIKQPPCGIAMPVFFFLLSDDMMMQELSVPSLNEKLSVVEMPKEKNGFERRSGGAEGGPVRTKRRRPSKLAQALTAKPNRGKKKTAAAAITAAAAAADLDLDGINEEDLELIIQACSPSSSDSYISFSDETTTNALSRAYHHQVEDANMFGYQHMQAQQHHLVHSNYCAAYVQQHHHHHHQQQQQQQPSSLLPPHLMQMPELNRVAPYLQGFNGNHHYEHHHQQYQQQILQPLIDSGSPIVVAIQHSMQHRGPWPMENIIASDVYQQQKQQPRPQLQIQEIRQAPIQPMEIPAYQQQQQAQQPQQQQHEQQQQQQQQQIAPQVENQVAPYQAEQPQQERQSPEPTYEELAEHAQAFCRSRLRTTKLFKTLSREFRVFNSRASRNQAEKHRRDMLNKQIATMAMLVPSISEGLTKKRDKISVLRLTSAYMRLTYKLGRCYELPLRDHDVQRQDRLRQQEHRAAHGSRSVGHARRVGVRARLQRRSRRSARGPALRGPRVRRHRDPAHRRALQELPVEARHGARETGAPGPAAQGGAEIRHGHAHRPDTARGQRAAPAAGGLREAGRRRARVGAAHLGGDEQRRHLHRHGPPEQAPTPQGHLDPRLDARRVLHAPSHRRPHHLLRSSHIDRHGLHDQRGQRRQRLQVHAQRRRQLDHRWLEAQYVSICNATLSRRNWEGI
ncbi:unnamed protein product [Trichogramma brassicae]|uniref:BHLH domain-containing protein n=1 Tax=Trichogramma brassicae TaxID=86971 RepID=A0A6H5IZ56_9HYME|nr:unnamed protein product [Trichogramma brassicae]